MRRGLRQDRVILGAIIIKHRWKEFPDAKGIETASTRIAGEDLAVGSWKEFPDAKGM